MENRLRRRRSSSDHYCQHRHYRKSIFVIFQLAFVGICFPLIIYVYIIYHHDEEPTTRFFYASSNSNNNNNAGGVDLLVSTTTTTKGTTSTAKTKQQQQKQKKSILLQLYGHIHIPHTNGTSINQQLAYENERVCSSSGDYSFDAGSSGGSSGNSNNKVPIQYMQYIGFENCDYISLLSSTNNNYTIWENIIDTMISQQRRQYYEYQILLDLHVPCPPSSNSISTSNYNRNSNSNNNTTAENDDEEEEDSIQLMLIRPWLQWIFDICKYHDSENNNNITQNHAGTGKVSKINFEDVSWCHNNNNNNNNDDDDDDGKIMNNNLNNWKQYLINNCGFNNTIQNQFSNQLLLNTINNILTTTNDTDTTTANNNNSSTNVINGIREISCFASTNNNKQDDYVNYMSQRLQSKKFPLLFYDNKNATTKNKEGTTISSSTSSSFSNIINEIDKECAIQIRNFLIVTYDYFQFCDQCMGTSQELNLTSSSTNSINEGNGVASTADNTTTNRSSIITIYGHLHMAKTCGTDINGYLANHFERICGNKGYSYNAIQATIQYVNIMKQLEQQQQENNNNSSFITATSTYNDLIKMWNGGGGDNSGNMLLGKTPQNRMEEIGYHDCDYISSENEWSFWNSMIERTWKGVQVHNNKNYNHTQKQQQQQTQQEMEFELHIPCRDPLDHAMSLCNHHQFYNFKCNTKRKVWQYQLRQLCKLDKWLPKRFSYELLKKNDDNSNNYIDHVYCFQPLPSIQPYLDYMSIRLQRRKIEIPYIHRSTNLQRNISQECIFDNYAKNNKKFARKVRSWLLQTYDYYQYCEDCIGSDMELKLV